MKVSPRARQVMIWTGLLATVAAVLLAPSPDNTVQPARKDANPAGLNLQGKPSTEHQVQPKLLPQKRTGLGYMPKDLFHAEVPRNQLADNARPVPAPKPMAPPLPYSYMGRILDKGKVTVFLTRDEKPYVVQVGDVLDGQYRVDLIQPPVMELTYLPLAQKQRLNIGPDQ
ncbi:MAG TPA: hypothetical protein VFF74_05910 [Methylophilaceae bacterium]|nr:hypothetical protein [Methylophilaceae bacterium]